MELNYDKIKAWAIRYTKKIGKPNDADDIAQEIYMALFNGRCATYEQIAIDYLRKNYGSKRSHCGLIKQRTRLLEEADLNRDIGHEFRDRRCDYDKAISNLFCLKRETHQLILEKAMAYGESQKEIALEENLTASRISQIIKTASKELSKIIMINEFYDDYKSDKSLSVLRIDWITL